MKNETPFNPIPLPENLKLSMSAESAQAKSPNAGPEPVRTHNARKRTRKTKQSNNDPGQSYSRWNRIKDLLSAKVAVIERERLKSFLLASGVAAAVLAAVLVAIKMMPAAMLILAILGIGAALRFWDRLRHLPLPF
jgi:hypothetical protein